MDAPGGLAGGIAHAVSMAAAIVAKLACEIFLSMDITSSEARRMALAAVESDSRDSTRDLIGARNLRVLLAGVFSACKTWCACYPDMPHTLARNPTTPPSRKACERRQANERSSVVLLSLL